MRCSILCILLCAVAVAQDAAGIDGVVIDVATRQPMAGVHVSLRHTEDAWGAISRADGHFSIAGIPPGIYSLLAQRNGYLRVPDKGSPWGEPAQIVFKAGEHRNNAVIQMARHAVIAGRVTDESGDPVQDAHIQAVSANESQTGDLATQARTDERGMYRLTGPPGKYRVEARGDRVMGFDGVTAYAPTWYPSALSREQARTVEAASGRDANGVDIQLALTTTFSVSGVVTGPGAVSGFVFVRTVGNEDTAADFSSGDVKNYHTDTNGKFVASGLAPGRYEFVANGDSHGRSERVEVNLANADVTGVILPLEFSQDLSGTLAVEGHDLKTVASEDVVVRLLPSGESRDWFDPPAPRGGHVDSEGAFHIQGVFRGKFRLSLVNLPENAFVQRSKLGASESEGDSVDLTNGVNGADLKVVVNLDGAQLEGHVTDADGKPLADPHAFVTLATTREEIGDASIQRAESGGAFRFTGLRPGKYRIVGIDSRDYTRQRELLRAAFAKASEFEIRPRDRLVKDVSVSPMEAQPAEH